MVEKKPILADDPVVRQVFELHDKAGISGAAAAEALKMTPPRISEFRRGVYRPQPEQLALLADLVERDVLWTVRAGRPVCRLVRRSRSR